MNLACNSTSWITTYTKRQQSLNTIYCNRETGVNNVYIEETERSTKRKQGELELISERSLDDNDKGRLNMITEESYDTPM